ncbi:hypothetical protein [Pseudomonas sp. S36]|uniref:hypothetical protein n=1 Tax=Pseudomonas sp. S36 TaxID=2767447 RepID=UPI001913E852|nr:hypothetical protein [Pseudomonas sp. S36]MBK4989730.1 hypothetical protein [Pseudomonas sp. S36]
MEAHFEKMPIPEGHRLVRTGLDAKGSRRGEDTDIYTYDEINADGAVVASYEVEDSMSIYPPFSRRIEVSRTARG